jgi:hypothetical protein
MQKDRPGGLSRYKPASGHNIRRQQTNSPDLAQNNSLARLKRQAETKGFLPRRALGPLQGAGDFCGPRSFARKLLQCTNIFGRPRSPSSFH